MTTAGASVSADLLEQVLVPQPPPFALLHRPETSPHGELEILVGEVSTVDTLADLPLSEASAGADGGRRQELLAIVPYRQIAERGYA